MEIWASQEPPNPKKIGNFAIKFDPICLTFLRQHNNI